ncbi:YveK family protein [Bacillus sp. USDA818B3_A]|uniref:YveK family protein n=1 Tax=Bacillus sp. USDA818B3_A TaxID=2698834 RepID=UPI001EFF65DD|nr:Wzz/FepE/Etk N-terminal domain-containing protein [Bacillus sp. USDA818B3_A]
MNNNDGMYVQPMNKAKEINLKELFSVIKKRLWMVIVITIVTTAIGTYYSNTTYKPVYQTACRIIVEDTPDNRTTLLVIIKDTVVLEKVVNELGLPVTPETLAGQITVESIEGSQVISIGVTESNPEMAANIANTTARIFKEEIPKIMKSSNVRILSEAKINSWPINPPGNQMKIISVVIGLVIGMGLVFLLDSLDEKLRTNREVEVLLGLPVLGRIPKKNKKNLKVKRGKQMEFDARGESIGDK